MKTEKIETPEVKTKGEMQFINFVLMTLAASMNQLNELASFMIGFTTKKVFDTFMRGGKIKIKP